MRTAMMILLAAMLAGCNSSHPEPQSAAAPVRADTGEAWVTGTVRVVGSAPVDVQVVVAEEGQPGARVEGPLSAEIGRLSGAQVAVRGRVEGRTIHATDYVIQAVDGRPVVMGVVEQAPDGGLQLRTERGEIVRLSGAEAHLRVGQKVWVQGAQQVQVQSYGVIRP